MDPVLNILYWTAAICGALLLIAVTAALCGLLGLFVLTRYRRTHEVDGRSSGGTPLTKVDAEMPPTVAPGTWYSKTVTTFAEPEELSCACGGKLEITRVEATDTGAVTTYRCEKCAKEFTS